MIGQAGQRYKIHYNSLSSRLTYKINREEDKVGMIDELLNEFYQLLTFL